MIRTVSGLSSFVLPAATIGAVTIGIVPASALGTFSYLASQIIHLDISCFLKKSITAEPQIRSKKPEIIPVPTEKDLLKAQKELSDIHLKKDITTTITRFVAAWAFATAFGLTSTSILPSLAILSAVFVIQRYYQGHFNESLENTIEKISNRVLGYAK